MSIIQSKVDVMHILHESCKSIVTSVVRNVTAPLVRYRYVLLASNLTRIIVLPVYVDLVVMVVIFLHSGRRANDI